MKKLKINRLDWDSNFFKLEVGEAVVSAHSEIDPVSVTYFDLIVVKQTENRTIEIDHFQSDFQETKVVFSKKLDVIVSNEKSEKLFDTDEDPIQTPSLYPLAYESGKYSRFKLDSHFSENQFQDLYNKWIDNSLNKQFADKVFYTMESNCICGFVTIKKHFAHATIGLIAVADDKQGKGYGSQLLKKAEHYCVSEAIFELQIPTQKENLTACNFYTKHGYTIFEETIIKHYWKK